MIGMSDRSTSEFQCVLRSVTINTTDDGLLDILLEQSLSAYSFIDHLLTHFVSVNFLGGECESLTYDKSIDEQALLALCCEGERPFKYAKALGLFWFAKRLSARMSEVSRMMVFPYLVLLLKCIYLHQYLLGQERSSQLDTEFVEVLEKCEEELSVNATVPHDEQTAYYLIASYLSVFYYRYDAAEIMANRCSAHLQIAVNFTGALGKRTRFQQTDVANLVIRIDRSHELSSELASETGALPKLVLLDDDTLLNTVAFSDPDLRKSPILTVQEQCFILLLCELHRLAHPKDDLTNEQRLAYINTVLRQAYPEIDKDKPVEERPYPVISWPVITEALFRRSLLEHTSVRRTERALNQLEELSNQVDMNEPVAEKRSPEHFFFTRMPSSWSIQIEQARLLTQLGCYKSALDVFLRWNQWSEVIECYTQLGKRQLAEEAIRAQLDAGDQSAELYCALGDVTKNREYYWKAWEVSGERSARAMRSLAVVYMYVDKDYQKAIEYFDKSLQINNLQISLWFTFGCCCLQASEYAKAETAFRRCVTLDPENFEAWNNCASAVMLRGKKDIALKLLKEACKYSYDNWRIWENISLISADLGCFADTIQACHRIVDLREKYNDDQVLGVLSKAVLEDVPDAQGKPASLLRSKVLELFGRVTSANPTNAEIWTHYAKLLLGERPHLTVVTYQRAVQNLQHAHRCRVQPTDIPWEQQPERRTAVVDGLRFLTDTLVNVGQLLARTDTENGDTPPEKTDLQLAGQKAFIRSTMSTLRITIQSVIGHLKRVLESSITSEARVQILKQQDELSELLSTLDTALRSAV